MPLVVFWIFASQDDIIFAWGNLLKRVARRFRPQEKKKEIDLEAPKTDFELLDAKQVVATPALAPVGFSVCVTEEGVVASP